MGDKKAKIQDHRRASFDTISQGKVTFATFADTSSLAPKSSIILTSEHDSDLSLRNDSKLEKSTAELEAVRDATNFTREFPGYDERRAEGRKGRKAERRVRFVEDPETQGSTRERFCTPEPTPSRTQTAAHTNLQNESLRAVVASGESDARLQLDVEVNQVQPLSAKSRSSKKAPQVGRKDKERGRRVVDEPRPFKNRDSVHAHLNCDELEKVPIFHAKCPHCQKVFFARQHFTDHVNGHRGRRNHDCPVCNMKYTHKRSLTSHLFLHLSREKQAEAKQGWRHVCYFCKKWFKSPYNLSRHLLTHTKEKVGGRCPVCRKTFSSKQNLTHHRFLHLTMEGLSRACLFCGKMFPDNVTYQSHLGTHTEEFRCDQCGKLFARNSVLTEHKRLHSANPKRFKCDECGLAFARKSNLTSHTKMVHRKVKDFACPECPNMFGRKSDMGRHLKGVHLKIRHCRKTFTTKSSAWNHVKSVHPS